MSSVDLIGKRVEHDCGDPRCELTGEVIDIMYGPGRTRSGEYTDAWAVVEWDKYEGKELTVPEGYVQPVPISRVKVIEG